MTITEKILAMHSGNSEVIPGQFVDAGVDLALGNDITAPLAIEEFKKLGLKKVFDKNKVVLVPDHFTPGRDVRSAQQARTLKDFSVKYGIKNYFEIGRMGVEHALLPEQGFISPGMLIIGADSHTCTYGALGAFSTGVGSTDLAAVIATGKIWLKVPETIKFVFNGKRKKYVGGKDFILYAISKIGVDGARYCSMEFSGNAIRDLGMEDRLSMCNMAIEAGGKNGIIEPDEITAEYLKKVHSPRSTVNGKRNVGQTFRFADLKSDKDAVYKDVIEIDASKIDPFVACPPLPSNGKTAKALSDVKISQAFLGSCTNGRIEDMRLAAKIIKGHKVKKSIRFIVIPATQNVYMQALKEGILELFTSAGGTVCTPSCGPCLGGHCGVIGSDEVCVATSNRNFTGRMGAKTSKVYLANAAVVAASAITGKITDPNEI